MSLHRNSHIEPNDGRPLRAVFGMILVVVMLAAGSTAKAQQFTPDSVLDSQVDALFTSNGSMTPIFFQQKPFFFFGAFPGGGNGCNFVSAAYSLGNGLYLYAYEIDAWGLICTVTQFTVPLGGNPLVPFGAVTTGAFVANANTSYVTNFGFWKYSGSLAVFDYYQAYEFALPPSDVITAATLVGPASTPSSIVFTAPGDPILASVGLPQGVYDELPVFGFITNVAPVLITGQFAFDSAGNPWPIPFKIVAPGGVTLWDPIPDLVVPSNPSNIPLTTSPDYLATLGRYVQGISADGATEVLLRLPAGSAGDKFVLTLQNFASANDDGAFGDALNPSASGPTQSSLTVTAVTTTNQGPMAFALYRAPMDFAQASVQGVGCATRLESVQVVYTPNGTSTTVTSTFNITIMRPPVVLVHGIWSNQYTWDNFSPLHTSNGTDPCFPVRTADYSQFQFAIASPPIAASTPVYSNLYVLQTADSSSLGFVFNTDAVFGETNLFLKDFKGGQNALQIPVAALQADFVTHSMGGDIVRTIPFLKVSFFYDGNSFGKGLIHKLITIGTPHLGSPLATLLPQSANPCVQDLFATFANSPVFTSVTFNSGYSANGAMFDLAGAGFVGGSMSQALTNISSQGQAQLISGAMIAGVQPDFSSLDVNGSTAWWIRNVACRSDYLASQLTSAGWLSMLSSSNDAIVPLASQWDGQSGIQQNGGIIHTTQLTTLGFTGIGELDPASGIANQVILLLNTPITNTSSFKQLTP